MFPNTNLVGIGVIGLGRLADLQSELGASLRDAGGPSDMHRGGGRRYDGHSGCGRCWRLVKWSDLCSLAQQLGNQF